MAGLALGGRPATPRQPTFGLVDALGCLRRLVRLTAALAWHGGRWGLGSLWGLLPGARTSQAALLGRFLTELCEALGATFIKGGQVLSSRPDLLPQAIVEPLRRLQDQVAPFALEPAYLAAALGRPFESVFRRFDRVPIASASVAQVHRAELLDGRAVAVKIRRPGVERTVADDLRLFRLLAGLADRLPALRLVPLRELLDEVGQAVEQQLDFLREAENNRRFRRNFRGVDRVRFPELVDDLCTRSVVVMELLEDLGKVDAAGLTPGERERAAVAGLRALYQMIFRDGFIHADLHPGNVFLRRWGEVVLLDVGLVAELSASERRDFVEFFLGMVTNDGRRAAGVVERTAPYKSPAYDQEAFTAAMIQLIDRHASLPASDFEVTRFAFQLFDLQRRHGIRGSTDFTMTILSLAVFEGIVKELHPRLDFQREARGYLIAAKYRRDV